jgi:hypothetical protein
MHRLPFALRFPRTFIVFLLVAVPCIAHWSYAQSVGPLVLKLSTAQGPAFALGKAGNAGPSSSKGPPAHSKRGNIRRCSPGRDPGREFGALKDGVAVAPSVPHSHGRRNCRH